MKKSYLLAEIGVNHEGSIDLALEMVNTAKIAGVNGVKFQTYSADKIAALDSPSYWDTASEPCTSQYELFKKWEQPELEFYKPLISECNRLGVDFVTTCFDEETLAKFEPWIPFIKISSSDITNIPLIDCACSYSKSIVLSCGASSMDEIRDTVSYIRTKTLVSITILHCVLNYPCKPEHANISMILTMKELAAGFKNVTVGYSCHVPEPEASDVSIAACILGAELIEKHYTTSRVKKGNDHYHAWTAEDVVRFREHERKTLLIMGSGVPDLQVQQQARINARRGIYLKMSVNKGQIVRTGDLITLRPKEGMCASSIWDCVGKKWQGDYQKGDALYEWMVEK